MKEIGDLTRSIVDRAKSYGADTVPLSNPATLKAPCPKCGGKIVENYRRFACTSCDYSIPKHPGGRTFAPEEVDELLTKGRSDPSKDSSANGTTVLCRPQARTGAGLQD